MRTGTALRIIAIVFVAVAVVGCSGGNSSSPTQPTASPGGGSAVISGSVSTQGGAALTAQPLAAAPAARGSARPDRRGAAVMDDHAPSGGGAAGSVTAADESGSGVTVRIQGTGISAVADAQGNFRLSGVPGGNQVVVFDTGSSAPGLLVEGIQSNETIDLDVTVSGSTVEVNSMSRSGGDDEEESLDPANLFAELAPDEWNLNFAGSSGTVDGFLRGEGFELIDLTSIAMEGDDPDADPLAADSASRQGDHVRARFPKNRVIGLLADPQPGSMHTVLLTFSAEGGDERFEVAVQVTIEDDDDGGDDGGDDGEDDDGEDDDGGDDAVDLSLQIQPDTWNTNWLKANGTVSALIRGDGFEEVDVDSVVLIGTDPDADPLAPQSVSAQGNHVRARFGQSAAFATLQDGDTGQTHLIVIRFTVGGEEMELSEEIRTVGPAIGE